MDGLGAAAEGVRRRAYERLSEELIRIQKEGEDILAAEALRRFAAVA